MVTVPASQCSATSRINCIMSARNHTVWGILRPRSALKRQEPSLFVIILPLTFWLATRLRR
eukprot:4728377-Lingulodinium_polyedra.AAC.1